MTARPPHTILCVDDEKNILSAIRRLLRKENYEILTATSGQEALEILRNHPVQLIMCDQRMPGMSGIEFLEEVSAKYPDTIRITLTGYTEVDSITEAVNRGAVHKFFLKPWNDQSLQQEVRKALERYDLMQANKELHEKVLKQNEELRLLNEDLEERIRQRTQELTLRNQVLELSRAVLEELPIAVFGISEEGMIALHNRMAQEMEFNGPRVELGQRLADCFPEDLAKEVHRVINASDSLKIERMDVSGMQVCVHLIPLRGRMSGNGVVVTLSPVERGAG